MANTMAKTYFGSDENRGEGSPVMARAIQGQSKEKARRGEEEGKKRVRRGKEEGKRWNSVGISLGRRWNSIGIAAMMVVMMMAWMEKAVAQEPDYSGTYYIVNNAGYNDDIAKRYYLCPSTNLYNENKPFLTTYKTNRDPNSIWKIEYVNTSDGIDYYRFHHMLSDRYLKTNEAIVANEDRARVHLEAATQQDFDNDTQGDFLFFFANESSNVLNICPKTLSNRPNGASLNPAKGNKDSYAGLNSGNPGSYTGWDGHTYYFGGIVGVYDYNDSDGYSKWRMESASPALPTITNNFDGTITLACETVSATIYYTTDGSDPTWINPGVGNTTQTYDGNPFTLLSSTTIIKAIAYKLYNGESQMTTYNVPQYTEPTISFNSSTSQVTINGLTDATIYYTTDGSIPTASNYTGTGTTTVTINNITSVTTVKAIATHAGYLASEVATLTIAQVATPTIQNNGSNAISITCDTEGATIYYTTDGSIPTTSSTPYTTPLTDNVSNVTIKAIAVKEGMLVSDVGSGTVMLQCAAPFIRNDGNGFMVICDFPSLGVTIYYEIAEGQGTPAMPTTSSSSTASGVHVDLPPGYTLPVTVRAIATAENYNDSEPTTTYLDALQELEGSGTLEDPYFIANQMNVIPFVEKANSEDGASAYYKVTANQPLDFSVAAAITRTFTGHFDGNLVVLSGLEHALFNVSDGATIKNVILDNVTISTGSNVGAICNEATGASRIYNCGVLATGSTATTDKDGYTSLSNCSSTIGGSGYVGGIVGLLDGTSRVINCFSYANITGGNLVGGIVGKNNFATTAATDNQKTMVMNCMFYGDITGGTSKAPIYNGEIITNDGDANGVNNFNYFRSEASYVQGQHINVYNCALAAETRFLQRFEFFRHLLNSNRSLAAWWATGNRDNTDEMMKWVMDPSKIGTTTPYPILKTPGKYPSVVNFTPSETLIDENNEHRNEGRKLGTLTVHIQMGSGGAVYGPPTGAEISMTNTNHDTTLIITDKDPAHFNFNYGKVQLPYYNQVGTKNYNGNRVVTGWKIVSITGGTTGTFTVPTGSGPADAPAYNFADRNCTNKDLYGEDGSNRIFNQGAYWDVPEGVTAITIEPYWAKCVYLSDSYLDVVYKSGTFSTSDNRPDAMRTPQTVTSIGGGSHYTNNTNSNINGENQKVYTSLGNATSALSPSSGTVYDNAIVLVGNYHYFAGYTNDNPNNASIGNNSHIYTVMSIDRDFDNEPDANLIMRFNGRSKTHAVRYDFLNLIGLGMAQKVTGDDSNGTYNFGIMQPLGWFEVTNTALFRCTQFEYSPSDRTKKPIILQGGVVEQWVTQQQDAGDKVEYFHVGGNVWFKEFHRGSHQDNTGKNTPHPPVSVTGGDFDEFYLTGLYQPQATIYNDNAECYINGGRFGVMAGAGMEGIGTTEGNGNITWIIDNADINEFYGGGINASKPVFGNISTTISNSHVDSIFCGGPKFGDMQNGRTVTTEATNCTFKTFFGAGYGGNSYSRYAPFNHNNLINFPHSSSQAGSDDSWNAWVNRFYSQSYSSTYGGVSTQINYQFIPHSSNIDNVARLWIEYVSLSLATTHTVSSTLTGCTVTNNFYGGGSLGKVDVSVTSLLNGCKVKGNVFGAGFSVSVPSVEVMDLGGFETEPHYDEQAGVFLNHVFPKTKTYTWEHAATVNSTETAISTSAHKLYTTEDLETLGTVDGNVTLTITGNSVIGTDGNSATGNVYGGGDESAVTGNTTVKLQQGTHVFGNVFGGGNNGNVGGNASVIIQDDSQGNSGNEGSGD